MYEKHFGLTRRPFATVAEASVYYPISAQEAALKRLAGAFRDQEGLALLTGVPGTGKTLVTQRLIDQIGTRQTIIWVSNTHLPDCKSLFQALLYDLDEAYDGRTEQELRLRFTDVVLGSFRDEKPVLLVIDEAHLLKTDLLEEFRLLSNLEARQHRALQILLVGQPSLCETVRRPELSSLGQRISTRIALAGMELEEGADYLVHHLRAAGARPERIITDEAVELLARATHGIPRLINQATHLSLQLASGASQTVVDAESVLEALGELGLGDETEPSAAGIVSAGAGAGKQHSGPLPLGHDGAANGKAS